MCSFVCDRSPKCLKYFFGKINEENFMNPPICENENNTLKYFSGQLSSEELSRTETHIAECGACCQALTSLAKMMNPETSEETAFLAANFEKSKKEALKLVKETLGKDSQIQKPSNIVLLADHKQEPKTNSIFSWKTGRLALAASLAFVFLVVIAIYSLKTTQADPLVEQSLAVIKEINLKNRPTKLRFAELEFTPQNSTRGNDTDTLKDKLNAAIFSLGNLVEKDPTSTNRQTFAQALILAGEPDRAVEQLFEAAKVDPNNPSIFSDIALCRAIQNNYQMALESVNKALSIDKKYLPAIFNRALIYQELKQVNEARLDLETYLKLDSSSPWANEAKNLLDSIE